jgi:hypothetical protein
MYHSTVDAHVHYRHAYSEVQALNKAIIPLHDNILAVSTPSERGQMRRILRCDYFRYRDALNMRNMLIRAVKHARANLADYFPLMRGSILQNAQDLEDAVMAYAEEFSAGVTDTAPTH